MINRKLKAAAGLLAAGMAVAACMGCAARKTQDLDILCLEEGADSGSEAVKDHSEEGTASEGTEDKKAGGRDSGREEEKRIFVYVCGAVQAPGVYELEDGARLYEAIASAGGIREDAAEESINQAQAVADGERLYIPTDEEVRQGLEEFLQSGVPVGDGGGTRQGNGGVSGGSGAGAQGGRGTDSAGRVNINTASREELKTLNGIGDTRAESILSYREQNGPFQSVEDLMKVDGIKEGIFNKMKDSITVD